MRVRVRAPAKVNLALGVGAPGRDGYHPLATVFHAVGLFDEVSVEAAEPGTGVSVRLAGAAQDGVPLGSDNLAVRAALLHAERTGAPPDLRLSLTKAIPVAGGLAGGSADAAATLVGCDALRRTALSRTALHELAAALGSDVPFALAGGTAVGSGRGERLTPVLARGSYSWVLATAAQGLSTPAVYRELDRLRDGSRVPQPVVPDALMGALRRGDAEAVGAALGNDLERAAASLRPALRDALDVGLDAGALGAVVSGSGPTCAFLVRDAEHALDVAVSLSAAGVCEAVHRVSGPVPGARVVGAA